MNKLDISEALIKDYEIKIINKLSDNPHTYVNMTTENICKNLFISKSTFLRLLKKINIKNTKELKNILIEQMERTKDISFVDIIIKNLRKNKKIISNKEIQKLINKINKKNYVYLFGVSSNYYLIKILEIYFRKCGINAIAVNSWEKINIMSKKEQMCIVIFSRSMESSEANIFKKEVSNLEGIDVFAITENTTNFPSINSIKISSLSPLGGGESELPLFYNFNAFSLFIDAIIEFLKVRKT